MEDIQQALGRRLLDLRVRAGMSQEELARSAHLSRAHLSELESGKAEAGLNVLGRLAGALGVQPSDLLRGAKAATNPPRKLVRRKGVRSPAEKLGRLVTRLAHDRDDRVLQRFTTIARAFFAS